MLRLHSLALDVLAECDPKPIIAWDLDFTLWPSNCYEATAGPYESALKGAQFNSPRSAGRCDVIYCTDKKSNTMKAFKMYPETRSILEFCAEHNIVMTICSKSPDVNIVEQIMRAFGIWEWFLFPQVYNKRKTFHFRNLTEATGFKMRDFLFYDDDMANITMCTKMGVNSVLVDKTTGLNWTTFIQGLNLYKEKLNCRRSFTNWLGSTPPSRATSQNNPVLALSDDSASAESESSCDQPMPSSEKSTTAFVLQPIDFSRFRRSVDGAGDGI